MFLSSLSLRVLNSLSRSFVIHEFTCHISDRVFALKMMRDVLRSKPNRKETSTLIGSCRSLNRRRTQSASSRKYESPKAARRQPVLETVLYKRRKFPSFLFSILTIVGPAKVKTRSTKTCPSVTLIKKYKLIHCSENF
jgi:hypothetical protein